MEELPITHEAFEALKHHVTEYFTGDLPSVEVSEGGLVTLTMSMHGVVIDLTMPDDLRSVEPAALQHALISAFNGARAEVSDRRRRRLAEVLDPSSAQASGTGDRSS